MELSLGVGEHDTNTAPVDAKVVGDPSNGAEALTLVDENVLAERCSFRKKSAESSC